MDVADTEASIRATRTKLAAATTGVEVAAAEAQAQGLCLEKGLGEQEMLEPG